ncbi:MAG: DUF1579 domain-containing protein [Ignavibacteriaceae bacterium]|jgi:hypothetical protein
MKLIKTFLVVSSAVLLFTNISFAQDQNQEEAQKIWMEYMTPGWAHELLASHAGEWKSVTTYWMDPSAPPQTMEGTTKNEMIMGGRYLKSTHSGEMMGMPFEGMSLEGYDNAKKEFTSVWIDNFGTGTSISTGKYDKETNSIIYKGTVYEPMQGKDVTIKQVVKYIDKDHHTIEMYTVDGEQETKTMQIAFTRKM